jgi:virginiamycin A acetyltransferase
MVTLVEEIVRLDSIGDHKGVFDYIRQDNRDPNDLVFTIYQLLLRSSFRGAYLVAKSIKAVGDVNPIVAFALALGGVLFGDASDEAIGRATLQGLVDALPGDKQSTIYSEVISKAIPSLAYHFFVNNDFGTLARVLEVLKAGVPRLRPIFDLSASAAPVDLSEMRRRGRERARLVNFPVPPAGMPTQARRVVVAIREYFLLIHTGSRPCDMGPRIAGAMNNYGWSAHYYGMHFANPAQDYRDIVETCRQMNAEVLILDDNVIQIEPVRKWRSDMLAELRRDLPDIKVVSVYFDPWMLKAVDLIDASALVDLIWTPFPSLPIWQHPEFSEKAFTLPPPLGFEFNPLLAPLRPRLTFAGGVMGYNWHRALWLGAAKHKGLPVDFQLSTHKPDGLPVLESYEIYLRRLADATASLNFSMRDDLSRITTGRTFETTLSGALLIEEWSPDIDHYFVSGEHCFTFSNFAELTAIARFIETDTERADEVRRNGFAFAREHYGDHNIIASLDHFLFHRAKQQPVVPLISAMTTPIQRLPLPPTQPAQGVMQMPADITHAPLPNVMQYMQDGVPVITVGRYSYINKLSTMTVDSRSRIVIGNFTSIAWDVLFLLRSNHHAEWATTYPVDWFPWDDSIPKPHDPHGKNRDNVTVGSDVWIGKGVTVMPGVVIGDGAIIAADAVVTKDVRPYAVIAGNPGREIKRRFDEETVDYLMDVKWWDMPNEFIMKHCNIICSADFEKLKVVLPPRKG